MSRSRLQTAFSPLILNKDIKMTPIQFYVIGVPVQFSVMRSNIACVKF